MSKIDEILKKSLQGKIATDPTLGPEEEPYTSNGSVDYAQPGSSAELFGLGALKDARFVPSTPRGYALFSQGFTTNVPRRFKRWNELALVFGADLFSEGTFFDLINASTFDSAENVSVQNNFSDSPNFGVVTDTFLLTHDADNLIVNPDTRDNLRVSAVATVSGTQLEVANGNLNVAGDLDARYRWSHYGFYPPKLLPLPNSAGEVTAYAAILPEDWPVYSWTREFGDLQYGSYLTKTAVSNFDISGEYSAERLVTECDTGDLAEGDFVGIQNRVFVVAQVVTIGGGRDNAFLFPLPPFEYDEITAGVGQTAFILYTVGELTADPSNSPGTDGLGNTLPPLYNAPYLDWIRVRRLVPPNTTVSNRSLIGAFIDSTPLDRVGLAPALIPATALGAADLPTSGVAEFSSVVLDTTVEEEQEILVDYREGIFHLSHAIEAGTALNPNSYTDAQGFPVLYALFSAYNGPTLPTKTRALQQPTTRNGLNTIPVNAERSPVTGASGWKFSLDDPDADDQDYYFFPTNEIADPGNKREYGGADEAVFMVESTDPAHSSGPMVIFQRRDSENGYIQVGGITFGGRGPTEGNNGSQITFIPEIGDEQNNLTSASRPDFRVATVKALYSIDNSFYRPVNPADTLAGTLNGIDFSIALIDDTQDAADNLTPGAGINVTDGQRSLPELIEDIVAKLPGTLTQGVDYDLYWYQDGADYVLVFEATQSILIDTDDANLFSTDTAAAEDILLKFGYARQTENVLRWVRALNELQFDGSAITVNGLPLGTPLPASYWIEGFELGNIAQELGSIIVAVQPGKVISPAGGESVLVDTSLTLADGNRYGIYYDSSAGAVVSAIQVAGADHPFTGLDPEDVPLYIVRTDSGEPNGVLYTVDVRDNPNFAEMFLPITVGATNARVTSLGAALTLAKEMESRYGIGSTIELLESTTLNISEYNTDDYPTTASLAGVTYEGAPIALPRNLKLKGNGYRVTLSGVPNQLAGFGDPIFRANQVAVDGSTVEFENVIFKLDDAETNPASLIAGNMANPGTYRLKDVTLEDGAIEKMHLIDSDPTENDAILSEVILENVRGNGKFSFEQIDRLYVRNYYSDFDSTAFFGQIGEVANVDGFYFPAIGSFIQPVMTDGSTFFGKNFDLGNFQVTSSNGANTDIKITLSSLQIDQRLLIGDGITALDADVTIGDVQIVDNATLSPAMFVRDTKMCAVQGLDLESSQDVSLEISDSAVSVQNFQIRNLSATSGSGKNGILITGNNGVLEGGVNLADSDTRIQGGTILCDDGFGIYVRRGTSAGLRTVIQGVTFLNDTLGANARGVALNTASVSPSGDNARNVNITHCVFDQYDTTGGETYAIGSQAATGTPVHILIYISFNLFKGLTLTPGAYFDLTDTNAGAPEDYNEFTS